MMNISHEVKLTYLAMLFELSYTDGRLDLPEDQFIDRISERLRIPYSEKVAVMENPSGYITKLPDTYAQRIEFLYNLLFMMGIDDKVTEEELALVKRVGFKLCFNPMLLNDLTHIMIDNLGKNVPVDAVVQAVVKYQN